MGFVKIGCSVNDLFCGKLEHLFVISAFEIPKIRILNKDPSNPCNHKLSKNINSNKGESLFEFYDEFWQQKFLIKTWNLDPDIFKNHFC